MTSYIEKELTARDVRFRACLEQAEALWHYGERGAQFEREVVAIIQEMLPWSYQARGVLLEEGSASVRKQLDLVVHPGAIPAMVRQLPIEVITIAGEIKTRLSDKQEIRATAETLATAAMCSPDSVRVPFLVLAGALKRGLRDHLGWLTGLVAHVTEPALPAPVLPAVFSFDEASPGSALRVDASAPIQAVTAGGEVLDGVVGLAGDQLSPAVLLYLWIWAAIHASDVHGMDYRYMRHTVRQLCDREGGLDVLFRPSSGAGETVISGVSLQLTDHQTLSASVEGLYDTRLAPGSRRGYGGPPPWSYQFNQELFAGTEPEQANRPPAIRDVELSPRVVRDHEWFMLISLGSWVDEPDSWDESPWGGSPHAVRDGHGYYQGMTDQELLDACRLFWKFNPRSDTWDGIDHAVVAHSGRVRAVVQIDRYIGPLWGRYGFQGKIVTDPALLSALLGREVPIRQNPITTIEL